MIYVLDAPALIALLRQEPAWEVVEGLLVDPDHTCFAHAVNLCEVYYDFARALDERTAQNAIQDLYAAGIVPREDMDQSFWQDVGHLKSSIRASLADCFGVAMARRVNAELVTSDHRELEPVAQQGLCLVRFFR
jgi:predicted nucleic acid-binding protein